MMNYYIVLQKLIKYIVAQMFNITFENVKYKPKISKDFPISWSF